MRCGFCYYPSRRKRPNQTKKTLRGLKRSLTALEMCRDFASTGSAMKTDLDVIVALSSIAESTL